METRLKILFRVFYYRTAEVVFHILLVQDIVIIVKKRSPANFGLMTKHSQNLLMKAQHELLHILELSTGTAFG